MTLPLPRPTPRQALIGIASSAGALAAPSSVHAQAFQNCPMALVLPFAPRASFDPTNLDPAFATRLHAGLAKAGTHAGYPRALDKFDVHPQGMTGEACRAYAMVQLERQKALPAESGFRPA